MLLFAIFFCILLQTNSYTIRYIDVGYSYVANPLYDYRTQLLYFAVPPNSLIGRYNVSSGKTETLEYGKSCTVIPNYSHNDALIVTNGLYIDRYIWPLDGSQAFYGGNYNRVYSPDNQEISISLADKSKQVVMGMLPGGSAPAPVDEDNPTILATLTKNNKVYENTFFDEHMTVGMGFWHNDTDNSTDLLYTSHTSDRVVSQFAYYPNGQFYFLKHVLEDNLKNREGYPTGVVADRNGHLWIAIDTEGCVIEVDVEKDEILQTINLTSKYLTGMEFVGSGFDILYVTTNTYDLSGNNEESGESQGNIIVIEGLGVKGFPQYFEDVRLDN